MGASVITGALFSFRISTNRLKLCFFTIEAANFPCYLPRFGILRASAGRVVFRKKKRVSIFMPGDWLRRNRGLKDVQGILRNCGDDLAGSGHRVRPRRIVDCHEYSEKEQANQASGFVGPVRRFEAGTWQQEVGTRQGEVSRW